MFRPIKMMSCALLFPCFGLVLACGGSQKKLVIPQGTTTTTAATAPVVATNATNATNAPVATKPVSPSVSVSEEIARQCRLDFDNETTAPKFNFDKSDLLPADRDVLARIAKCVTVGPLKGHALKLVGRADPRGTVEYNMALGDHRAHSVGDFLERLGVNGTSIDETSRGKLDAVGTNEATWAVDRRTDVLLGE